MTKINPAPAAPLSDPIVRILAEMIISASRRTNLYVTRELGSGGPIVEPCACKFDIGDGRCVCRVEVPVQGAWRGAAARHVAAGESVGILPRRRCRLCVSGEHDLAPSDAMKITVAGRDDAATVWVARPSGRRRRDDEAQASRARAYRPGTRAAEMDR